MQVDESAIIENLELACNPAKPDGQWITHYDMVEDGDKIKLVDTKQVHVNPVLNPKPAAYLQPLQGVD
jgi:hypothetical protein